MGGWWMAIGHPRQGRSGTVSNVGLLLRPKLYCRPKLAMEKGREGAAVQPAAEGDATVATVWQSPATVRVRVESAEGAEETLSQQGNSSLPSFLSRTGLLSIADGLRRAGLLSVDDLLQLTPRKYAAVGVGDGDTELGTRWA